MNSEIAESISAPSPLGLRLRIALNRFLFRAMLGSMGLIAVILYRFNRELAWRFAKAQARNLARVCGVQVKVRGLEKLNGGPFIFTPNHQSHFDIAVLLGYLPGNNRFVAKRELFHEPIFGLPIFGLVLRTLGMVPIDRNDSEDAIRRFRKLGDEGYSTIIFPEGTRSPDGRLQPFKKGAFVAAIELKMPIVPVVCRGTHEVMPKGRYLSIVPGIVEIVILDPIPTDKMTYEDRDQLRELAFERIAATLKAHD